MSEWWTYRPSDFLLFAPRTYYRLVEQYNVDSWPWQLVALVAALALFALAWRGGNRTGRVVALALAVAWLAVGWRFHWNRYASINWAAVYFAGAFALQAGLLAWAGLAGRVEHGGAPRARRYVGLALVVMALALLPFVALAAGRSWQQLEVAGLAPDPTAIVTLGLLLVARRAHWSLYPVPILWCLLSGLTLWTMNAPDAWVPVAAAAVATWAGVALRPSRPR
jgi:hypothetical protein